MSIFVERIIDAPADRLWALTQTPEFHQRWDLRFTRIHYLPGAAGPQTFEYETRVAPGVVIRGTGQTTSEFRSSAGERSSALVFASSDPRSLIRKGSGYWQYTPMHAEQTRFATSYDYAPRWGVAGRIVDAVIFRPMMAWATAWSFDRLARWATRDVSPETSRGISIAYTVARMSLVVLWLYHGIVPKLLGPHPGEVALAMHAGISAAHVHAFLIAIGIGEVLIAALLALLWHRRWPAMVSGLLMILALLVVLITSPAAAFGPFNVVTTNIMVGALSAVVYVLQPDVVRAGSCRWRAYRRNPLTRIFTFEA
jgi:uncharacterized membrane protein YphA (DoxX/SURF4 family)